MIVDLILDRKDGEPYSPKSFYLNVMGYGGTFSDLAFDIARAMDGGSETDVKRELCRYIDDGSYNPAIKNYINSVSWL